MTGTGLFSHRHNHGARVWSAQRRKSGPDVDRAKLDAFAEALAETGTVAAASKAIGICHQRGSQLLARIKRELGWQAS